MQILAAAASYPRHQQVLILWNAGFFVVHHRMVAIEGEAVLHVAAHAEDGDRLIGGGNRRQPSGQRTRGVGAVEQVDNALGGVDGRNAKEGPTP